MEFNGEQRKALSSQAKNLLVLAGAGTGKTRTIIGRAGHLIGEGVPPESIAILTFTRRAAGEISHRLCDVVGQAASKVVSGTFHHFCLREMRARPRWFSFDQLTVMDRDDQLQLMKLVRGKVAGRSKQAPQANELLSYYSYARNTNQPVRDYLEKFTQWEGASLDVIEEIFAAYKQRKQQNSYFDYDDILHRFAKVMHDNASVRQRIAGHYQHILVDEMQDTNPLQWLILESLAKHANLFCVGDDAQSIYAFRGADFRNVHSFDERLDEAETLKLELNYRSTQEILDLANWLLGDSKIEYGKQLKAHRGAGLMPQVCDFETEFDEAKWIVDAILDRHQQGDAWHEHMILCRSGFNARSIEAELIERKVPYRFVGGIGLLQMAHVRDLLAAVRVIVNPRDEIGWMRYLTLWPRIGEVTASNILDQLRTCDDDAQIHDLLASLLKQKRSAEATEQIVKPLRRMHKLFEQPRRAVKTIAESLDALLAGKYDRWESRARDFQLLEQLAERHKTLAAFLETYTLDPMSSTEVEATEDRDDIVTLITVHSAKGTEAKTCFVAAVTPANYPHVRSLGDEDSIEEERRVLYVALTRAKDELFITRSLAQSFTRTSWNASSGAHYFLENLPSKLVRHQSAFLGDFAYDDDVIG